MESDITTKNIVREIVKECRNIGVKVEESTVFYFVNLLQLDPRWGINSDFLMNRTNVQQFVKHCVNTFKDQNCPMMIVLKMQLHFQSNYGSKEELVGRNRMAIHSRLAPLENDIVSTPEFECEEDEEKFFRKMVYYSVLLSGLGNPTVTSVYKEAHLALQSVFNEDEIEEFMLATRDNRADLAEELTELAAGVRLYNRDCKKGGEGIEDLPKLLMQAIEAIKEDLQKILDITADKVNLLTAAVENCFKIKRNEVGYYIEKEIPGGTDGEDLEYYKDMLLLFRQYEMYIRKISLEVDKSESFTNNLLENFRASLQALHDTCRFRTAVPTGLVFNHFLDLAHTWRSLQDEAILLAKYNQIMLTLQSLATELPTNEKILKVMVGHGNILSDEERLETECDIKITSSSDEMTIIYPEEDEDFDKIQLEFGGFCTWTLIETEGALIPGNPFIGIACVENKCYAFSCIEAAEAFSEHPKTYIMRALTLAREKIELINFLQLFDQLVEVQDVRELYQKPPKVVITSEVEIQTELHPVPTKIDPTYMWNIWDLKREALRFANMANFRTKWTQSNKISSQKACRTQTYETKDIQLQTKRDNYGNVPRPLNYIYGLRGRKDDKQFIIKLTRPIEE